MRSLIPILGLLSFTACLAVGPAGPPGPGAAKVHASARILLKENAGCKSRTIPKSHILLKDDEDEIVWDIKQQGNCLPGDTQLVLKWVDIDPMDPSKKTVITDRTKVPTECLEINTKDNGNKSKISCKLRADVTIDKKFAYQVYIRANGVDTVIEDPDVEIIMF
jgi:hypothetical protein